MRQYCGDDFDPRSAGELRSVCMALPLDQQLAADDGSAYSNVGHSVLGAIVEEVSGEPLEQYVARRLLAPAGIDEDGYGLDPSQRNRLAAGYLNGARNEPISERIAALHGAYWNLKGNGGMQLSPRAMHRWHQSLSCRAPMDAALRDLIVRPLVEPAGDSKPAAARSCPLVTDGPFARRPTARPSSSPTPGRTACSSRSTSGARTTASSSKWWAISARTQCGRRASNCAGCCAIQCS
jgi:CubicO group peptidase (beta-lactamase class C family)